MRFPSVKRYSNSVKMMKVTIPFLVDAEIIKNTILYEMSIYCDGEDALFWLSNQTKKKVWEKVLNNLKWKGADWFPEGRGFEAMRDEFASDVNSKVKTLFPELF